MRWLWLFALLWHLDVFAETEVRIGSKSFTENYVLAELTAAWLERNGVSVERRLGLGGTLIAHQALLNADIDLYPEYSGTLSQAILQQPDADAEAIQTALARQDLETGIRFGFNNTYALAMSQSNAQQLGISTITDLRRHPELRIALSLEFLERSDGWPALSQTYALPQQPVGIEHALAYRALSNGAMDVSDAYSTDGELMSFDLTLLEDDLDYFPRYDALLLQRQDLDDGVKQTLQALTDLLDQSRVQQLNSWVVNDGLSPAQAAQRFLVEQGLIESTDRTPDARHERVLAHMLRHLQLTLGAVLLACIIAIPLGIFVAHTRFANSTLHITSLIQTVPALALLALLIPMFGLGITTAITALFLYGLLPVLRNTITGITTVDPLLLQVADAMGMTSSQRMRLIEIPLAAPVILAGIKTATVICIGTATLAAFVGAGGLGEPIITGLTLNDQRLILEGAIPAALLAVCTEIIFAQVEKRLRPAHLHTP